MLANLVWADPGEISGWATFSVHPDALEDQDYAILDNVLHWTCGEIRGDEFRQVDQIIELYDAWDDAACGSEDFILNQFRRDRTLLVPVRINARLDYWLAQRTLPARRRNVVNPPRELFVQTASLAMRTMPDAALREVGYWERTVMPSGLDHARDATRHALTFFRRAKKDKGLRMRAWPHLFDPTWVPPEEADDEGV
jgi:hypothetical protein